MHGKSVGELKLAPLDEQSESKLTCPLEPLRFVAQHLSPFLKAYGWDLGQV